MPVISHPDQITPQWLTGVVNQAGYSGAVQSFAWQPIGAGQVGDNARLTLTGSGDLPTTLVAKFPSSDPVSRATGVQLQNYASEVFFYNELAPTVDVQTPKVFTTEFDPKNHDFIIIMEDLAPGVQIDQLDGCDATQAELALTELAKLHGPRWGDPTLAHSQILNPPMVPGAPTTGSMYEQLQPGFLERYQARLDSDQCEMVKAIGALQEAIAYAGPQTLIHIDFRLDNMIFGGPYPLAILDWQSVKLGCALADVAYFMGTSLEPELRRAHEQHLLTHYLATLQRYEIDLNLDTCWRLYRQHAPAGLNMAVIASMIVGETPRGNDMFMVMAKRSIAMCNDLETVAILRD